MELSASPPLSATLGPDGTQPGTGESSRTGLTSDFQTFLRMLTAQARNQDPLEPVNSSEYAAQLAQFAMVEQQVKANDALTALASPTSDLNRAGLAGWVGLEIRTTTGTPFSGTAIPLSVAPAAGADRASLVILDSSGNEIGREDLPPSVRNFSWTGQRPDGTTYPPGTYDFSVEYFAKDRSLGLRPAENAARVREARLEDGAVILQLDDGRSIPAASVIAVRQPTGKAPLHDSAGVARQGSGPETLTETSSASASAPSAALFDR